jgi:hypothetical protein
MKCFCNKRNFLLNFFRNLNQFKVSEKIFIVRIGQKNDELFKKRIEEMELSTALKFPIQPTTKLFHQSNETHFLGFFGGCKSSIKLLLRWK